MNHESSPPLGRPDDADPVVALAALDAFAPLRWLDRFTDRVSVRHRHDLVRGGLDIGPAPLLVHDGETLVGALLWRAVPDLAEHFDVSVHEVVAVLTPRGLDRRSLLVELLDRLAQELAGDDGFVMLRLEADDLQGLSAATTSGFELFETSLSFVNDLQRRELNPPYDPTGMRIHRFDDGPLPDEMRSFLHSAPTRVVDDHYHADPRLDDGRCDALYERLRDRVVDGIGADVLVYHELDGVVTGFGTFKRATQVEPYGITLLDGSIGFQFPGAPPGQSHASASFMCDQPLLDNRFVEWGTQATNYRMVNMLGGLRSVRLCRSSYVLHRWTDRP